MRGARQVTRMGKRRGAYRVLVGNLKERDHLEDLGVKDIKMYVVSLVSGCGGMD